MDKDRFVHEHKHFERQGRHRLTVKLKADTNIIASCWMDAGSYKNKQNRAAEYETLEARVLHRARERGLIPADG